MRLGSRTYRVDEQNIFEIEVHIPIIKLTLNSFYSTILYCGMWFVNNYLAILNLLRTYPDETVRLYLKSHLSEPVLIPRKL